MQVLLERIHLDRYYYAIERDKNMHVSKLFFAFPSSIIVTNINPHVFISDGTCKTNQYKMPLMHAVGLSSVGTTFSFFFAFLDGAEEEGRTRTYPRWSFATGRYGVCVRVLLTLVQ